MRAPAIALLFIGCVRDAPLPDVGKCAVYPDAAYEFGQIGIGTCLAGPNGLQWAGDPEDPTLLVTNANPYKIFTGGSLLAIPWSNIDFGDRRNHIDTLEPTALDLPSFAGGLAVDEEQNLGIMGVRESDGGRTRVFDDSVYLLDLTDPTQPALSDRGTAGKAKVMVMSDPVDVAIDSETGYAFVANRTSHSISVLDITGEEVKTIQPWNKALVTAAAYEDVTGAGGSARLTGFEVFDPTLLTDDFWTLTWVDGTWRLWLPTLEGLTRTTTHGMHRYDDSAMGVELALENAPDDVVELADPAYLNGANGRMMFADDGVLRAASTVDYLGDWAFEGFTLLEGSEGNWDARLGGPVVTADEEQLWMFYDGQATDEGATGSSSIGAATSVDGNLWTRISDDALIEAVHPHEGKHIADPHIVYDFESVQWRMYYSAWDGTKWTIGHATSANLEDWTTDDSPIFEADDSVAAPVVHHTVGAWRMWYSRWDGEAWSVGAAESPDGFHWTDLDTVLDYGPDAIEHDLLRPPGIALQGAASDAFSIRGEGAGPLSTPFPPSSTYTSLAHGWTAELVAGSWLDLGDAGPDSNGGIRVDSIDFDGDDGVAWLTLFNRNGKSRIGMADIDGDDGTMSARWGATFEGGGEAFERGGVSHPVVFRDGDTFRMLYAGVKNGNETIGTAESSDGETWTSLGRVLNKGSEWDSVALAPNSVQVLGDGSWRLWYSGFDGARWRIGTAESSDGESWNRTPTQRGWELAPGAPGEWDDSGVRDAYVITDSEGDHMWYAGFDGDNWRTGYAFRSSTSDEWTRTLIEETEETRPSITLTGGLFHTGGVGRPVVRPQPDGWEVWYAGSMGGNTRVGKAFGAQPDSLNKTPRRPRAGDTLSFRTEWGDENERAIPLDGLIDGSLTSGVGLTSMTLDEERGMLYVVSKLFSYIFVIDVRDDTDLNGTGFRDLNYLDVEALLIAETSSAATGFRSVVPIPGTDKLYVICDAPETVMVMDISELEDEELGHGDAFPNLIYDTPTGWLVTPRGDERDEGEPTMSSVGPAQMLLHPDEPLMFVTNFNSNSITTYDLRLGPYGQLVHETTLVGENPYAMLMSPDKRHIVFANYTGELEGEVAHSTLGILDIDPNSPTYLEVRTWIVNR